MPCRRLQLCILSLPSSERFELTRAEMYQTTRTLRIFLSHTVSGQLWQDGETPAPPESAEPINFETGQGIPSWALKIEGRLLEVCISVPPLYHLR